MSGQYQIYGGMNVGNIVNNSGEIVNFTGERLGEVLSQLQQAVEEDTNLSPEDKVDLLEQVRTLAETKRITDTERKEALLRKASKMFEATLKSLPDNAKLVETYRKLFPLILSELNSDSLAVVTRTISPNQVGQVKFLGSWWMAKCSKDVVLEAGTKVTVVGRQNLTLLVEPAT
jgi:hypothetical protein